MTHRLLIPVSPGELLDRISILRIKLRRIEDRDKLKEHVSFVRSLALRDAEAKLFQRRLSARD